MYYDDTVRGLAVRVTPSGAKSFVLYRKFAGRPRIVTLGRCDAINVEQARRLAMAANAHIAEGRDPSEVKREARQEWTLRDLWDAYLERHAQPHKKTVEADRIRWANHLKPLAARRLSALRRSDVTALHQKIAVTAGPVQANRTLAMLSHMLTMASLWGHRVENVASGVKRFREERRERYLSAEELSRLGTALVEAKKQATEEPQVIAALCLLIFTGARMSEILTARWEYLDTQRNMLCLPESKTGAKFIHLNPPAIDVLSGLERRVDNPYIIPGRITGEHWKNLHAPFRRLCKAAGIEDLRIHDLRHSFASIAVSGGISLPLIGGLLGHTTPATTARYSHLAADPLKAAVDLIGRDISAAMLAPSGNNVVSIDDARKAKQSP